MIHPHSRPQWDRRVRRRCARATAEPAAFMLRQRAAPIPAARTASFAVLCYKLQTSLTRRRRTRGRTEVLDIVALRSHRGLALAHRRRFAFVAFVAAEFALLIRDACHIAHADRGSASHPREDTPQGPPTSGLRPQASGAMTRVVLTRTRVRYTCSYTLAQPAVPIPLLTVFTCVASSYSYSSSHIYIQVTNSGDESETTICSGSV